MPRVGRMVKEAIVRELTQRLSETPNVFVTRITRLHAPEADALRQRLFTSQARLFLVQRALGRRTIEGLKIPGLADRLEGSVGLVLAGDDALPVAKALMEFVKTHENQLAVGVALIDGQLLDPNGVEALAQLPPRPALLTQVVFTIESPIANLMATVEQLIGDLAWMLEQAAKRKEGHANG